MASTEKIRRALVRTAVTAIVVSSIFTLSSCFLLSGDGSITIPTGVQATQNTSADSITIAWTNQGSGVTFYVYRADSENGVFDLIANAISGSSFEDTDVSQNTHYWYKVSAADVYGENETYPSAAVEGWTSGLAAPIITPVPQASSYTAGTTVTVEISVPIQSSLQYPDIRFTTDGSEPTSINGTYATGPNTTLDINTTTTVRAVAIFGGIVSEIAEYTYTFDMVNWTRLGASEFSGGDVELMSIATYDGTPYVAYVDKGINELVVRSYNGTSDTWNDVGGVEGIVAANSSGTSDVIDMAIDVDGDIYVAFSNDSGDLAVAMWNGATWSAPFGGVISTELYQGVSISLSGSTPFVTFKETSWNGSDTHGYYYNGTSWVDMSDGDSDGYPGDSAYFGGALYVPSGNGDTTSVAVLKYADSAWSTFETFSDDEYSANLAADGENLFLIYNNSASPDSESSVTVRKFDGTTWTLLGDSVKPAGSDVYSYWKVGIAAHAGVPYALLKADTGADTDDLIVMFYEDGSWSELAAGGVTESEETPSRYEICVDPDNGSLYVTYAPYSGGITVKRFEQNISGYTPVEPPSTATVTVDGGWQEGSFSDVNGMWYSFPVTPGNAYQISCNDSDGNGAYYATDAQIQIYAADQTATYFSTGYKTDTFNVPRLIDVPAGETVAYIHVEPETTGVTGDFGIRVDSVAEVAVDGGWIESSVRTNEGVWLVSRVTGGSSYEVSWDDSWQGSGTYTGDIYFTAYSNSTTLFDRIDTAYAPVEPQTVDIPAGDDTIYFYAEPYTMGTFAVTVDAVAGAGPSSWQIVGNATFSSGDVSGISIATNSSDVPYVSFIDAANGDAARVMRLNGASWETVGSGVISAGRAIRPAFDFDSADAVYVAYGDDSDTDSGTDDKITVQKYDGTSWSNVGSAGFSSSGDTDYVTIALDSSDVPYVGYRNWGGGYQNGYPHVEAFEASTWSLVGPAEFTPGASIGPVVAIDNNDVLHVAFSYGFYEKASLMSFDGTTWDAVGALDFSDGVARNFSVAFDSSNTPYVAFRDEANLLSATVMTYNGTTWEVVGTEGFTGDDIYGPSQLVIDSNDTLYLAVTDLSAAGGGHATVMTFDGTNWVAVGDVGFSPNQANGIALAIDSNDTLYVAFRDLVESGKITVMKYEL